MFRTKDQRLPWEGYWTIPGKESQRLIPHRQGTPVGNLGQQLSPVVPCFMFSGVFSFLAFSLSLDVTFFRKPFLFPKRGLYP